MKIILYLIIGSLLIGTSCAGLNKRLKKGNKPETENNIPAPPQIENPAQIKVAEERLIPVNEKIPDPRRYFVIIGSFRNPENVKKYQVQIRQNGFESDVLKNDIGLYRVSVMATDDENEARKRIKEIWAAYPEYSDTWLLIQKK